MHVILQQLWNFLTKIGCLVSKFSSLAPSPLATLPWHVFVATRDKQQPFASLSGRHNLDMRMILQQFCSFLTKLWCLDSKFSSLAPPALAKVPWSTFGGRRDKEQTFASLCDWRQPEKREISNQFETFDQFLLSTFRTFFARPFGAREPVNYYWWEAR